MKCNELDISECDNFYSIYLFTKKVVSITAGSVDIRHPHHTDLN